MFLILLFSIPAKIVPYFIVRSYVGIHFFCIYFLFFISIVPILILYWCIGASQHSNFRTRKMLFNLLNPIIDLICSLPPRSPALSSLASTTSEKVALINLLCHLKNWFLLRFVFFSSFIRCYLLLILLPHFNSLSNSNLSSIKISVNLTNDTLISYQPISFLFFFI